MRCAVDTLWIRLVLGARLCVNCQRRVGLYLCVGGRAPDTHTASARASVGVSSGEMIMHDRQVPIFMVAALRRRDFRGHNDSVGWAMQELNGGLGERPVGVDLRGLVFIVCVVVVMVVNSTSKILRERQSERAKKGKAVIVQEDVPERQCRCCCCCCGS